MAYMASLPSQGVQSPGLRSPSFRQVSPLQDLPFATAPVDERGQWNLFGGFAEENLLLLAWHLFLVASCY